MTRQSQPPEPRYAGLFVEHLSIRHFRGVENCEVELEPGLTLLVGRNNVGKSRVLSALHLALGGRPADADDFTVGSEQEPQIDVVFAPPPPASANDEQAFETDVARRLGDGVQTLSEEPFRERFAWRTHVQRSSEGMGARSEFKVLTFDSNSRTWVERSGASEPTRDQRGVIASDLVNTGRDLMAELGRRGSGVRKVLSDLDVDDGVRTDLEERLKSLSAAIVDGSGTLASVGKALDVLNQKVGSIGAPGINPFPITLEELARTLSIDLDSGHGPLPIRMHGSGARSLTSLQVQGVLYDRLLGADGGTLRPHPVTLVEEPEAHLHPQACAELPVLLKSIRGQLVASTHSAQVVTSTEPCAIRLLREASGRLSAIDLGPKDGDSSEIPRPFRSDHHAEEMDKLKRLAERPFGEILFSNAIVVGDGATERGFIPPLLRHALGHKAHGVCVVNPESLNTPVAKAVAKFANLVDLPWFIFADSDDQGCQAAESLSATREDSVPIVWVGEPDPENQTGVSGAIEAMIVSFDESLAREACERLRPDLAPVSDPLSCLKNVKGAIGPTLAELFIDRYDDADTWPEPLRDLIRLIDESIS